MKNLREYYLGCLEAEKPKFVRVLKAVPGDQAAYRGPRPADRLPASTLPGRNIARKGAGMDKSGRCYVQRARDHEDCLVFRYA